MFVPAVVVAVGERRDEDGARQGLVVLTVDGLGCGHGHGLVSTAVETALEDDDVAATGRAAGQLDGRFYCFGTAVGEEEAVDGGWGQLVKFFGQAKGLRGHDNVHLGEDEFAGLLLNGRDDARVVVAGVGDADAGGEVGVAGSGLIIEVYAFAANGLYGGEMGPNWGE